MAEPDDILKQTIIAGHLKILYKEIRALKRVINEGRRESELDAGEQPEDGNFATDFRFSFDAMIVTSLVDDFNFLALRTIPTSADSPGWIVDPEFSAKFVTVTKPPNVDLPAVGDIVPAFFTGTYGDPPTPRYGVFGVGGGNQQLVVKTVFGDYLRCRTYINSVEGADDIDVAKPYKFRQTPFDGLTRSGISYGSYNVAAQTRYATVGGVARVQQIAPVYDTSEADLIYASKFPQTQAFVGPVQLTLMDINNDGRAWVTQ